MEILSLFRSIFQRKPEGMRSRLVAANGETSLSYEMIQSADYKYIESMSKVSTERKQINDEIDTMDTDDLVQSILDLYAESSSIPDLSTGKSVWPSSPNAEISKIIENLFERVRLEEIYYAMCRSVAKFGEDPENIITSSTTGVEALQWIHPNMVEVRKDPYGILEGYEVSTPGTQTKVAKLSPWDMILCKIPSGNRITDRGESVIRSTITPWKRLRVVEDMVIIYRLRSTPGRDEYYVEIGDAPFAEGMRIVRQVKSHVMQNRAYDPEGKLRADINPNSLEESIFIPTRNGTPLFKKERRPGEAVSIDIADLDYWISKFFGCARVPAAYFGFDKSGGLFDYGTSLIQKDIRFSRGCKKIQKAVLYGLTRLVLIQMAYQKIDHKDPSNQFTLLAVPVSFLDEKQRQELLLLRLDLMDRLQALGADLGLDDKEWLTFILKDIGGFTNEMVEKLIQDRKETDGDGGKRSGGKAPTPTDMPPEEKDNVPPDQEIPMGMIPPSGAGATGANPPVGPESLDKLLQGKKPLTEEDKKKLRIAMNDVTLRNRLLRIIGFYPSSDVINERDGIKASIDKSDHNLIEGAVEIKKEEDK